MPSRSDALLAPSPRQIVHHHLRGLDGMRGLAFLAVFTFHYAISSHAAHGPVHLLLLACSGGWMGVDLFFVLSGFLITGILLDTRDHPLYFRNFYARRALRIFPLFYGIFFLLLLLTPVLHLRWRFGHLLYPLYLGNIAGAYDFTLNSIRPVVYLTPLWSLAVEEQFYLLWPMLVLAIRTPRTLLRTCTVLLITDLILRAALFAWLGSASFEWCYMLLPMRADALLAGAVCAVLFRRHTLDHLLRRSRAPFVLSGTLLLCIFALLHEPNYHHALFTIVGYPLLAIFCAGLLLRFASPSHLLGKIGASRLLRFFGTYSYGMYVFHQLFIPAQEPVLRWLQQSLHSLAAGAAAYFALCLIVVSAVAVLSFHLFERPWLRLKRLFPYHVTDSPVDPQKGVA